MLDILLQKLRWACHPLISRTVELPRFHILDAAAREDPRGAVLGGLSCIHQDIRESAPHAALVDAGHLEVGGGHPRMSAERFDLGALRLDSVIEGIGEDQIGKLGLLVELPTRATEGLEAAASRVAPKLAAIRAQVLCFERLIRLVPKNTAVVHYSR